MSDIYLQRAYSVGFDQPWANVTSARLGYEALHHAVTLVDFGVPAPTVQKIVEECHGAGIKALNTILTHLAYKGLDDAVGPFTLLNQDLSMLGPLSWQTLLATILVKYGPEALARVADWIEAAKIPNQPLTFAQAAIVFILRHDGPAFLTYLEGLLGVAPVAPPAPAPLPSDEVPAQDAPVA